jgi:transcriptional regulator with XRE-family HTH domain
MKPFSDQLRDAVRKSGMSQSSICRETGILKSTMSRFVRGECGLGMDAIDRLIECINWQLVENKQPRRKGQRKS